MDNNIENSNNENSFSTNPRGKIMQNLHFIALSTALLAFLLCLFMWFSPKGFGLESVNTAVQTISLVLQLFVMMSTSVQTSNIFVNECKGNKKKVSIKTKWKLAMCIIAGLLSIVTLLWLFLFQKPPFIQYYEARIPPVKSVEELEAEISQESSMELFNKKDIDAEVYPFLANEWFNEYSIPHNVFDFFEVTGILDPATNETYQRANSVILNSPQSIILDLKLSYADVITNENNRYINLYNEYHMNGNMGIDQAIVDYTTMIDNLNRAKTWSLNDPKAAGVDIDLLVLIARNYKEKAYLLAARGDSADKTAAVENYISAIKEYAMIYRMCIREDQEQKLSDYNILYWIAVIYHNIGDISFNGLSSRLGSFVSADSFFGEHIGYGANAHFEMYARYYSAMSSHKTIVIVKSQYKTLPIDLKYYLVDAYENYKNVKDSAELTSDERSNAKQALKLIANDCLAYLDIYPEEENNGIMKSREYYEN